MKTVSNDFKLNVNSFGRQLDTLIYDWYKPEDDYKLLVGETTQDGTPTPTNPISIETVTGLQEINIVGTNVLKSSLDIVKTNNVGGTWSGNQYTHNGVTFTYNIDGSVTVSRIEVSNSNSIFYINRTGYKNTTLASGTYYLTSHEETGSNTTWKIQYNIGGANYNVYGSGNNKELQVNVSNDTNISAIIIVYSGYNPNNVIFHPMIAKTSGVNYEPYADKSYEINLGKNLFNHNEYPVNRTTAGVTITNNGDGSFTLNGTCNSDNSSFTLGSSKIPQDLAYNGVFTHTAYYVSGSCTKTSTSTTRCVIQVNYNVGSSMIPLEQLNANNNVISKTQLQRTSTVGWAWRILMASGDVYDNFTIRYQLEKGSQATSYSLYKEPIELCKIGDYQDYIYKENGNWHIHKEINKIVLNGNETNWNIDSTGTANYFYKRSFVPLAKTGGVPALSSHYEYKQIYTSNTNQGFYISATNTNSQIRIRYGAEDTITNFKTWLFNNNVSVYYVLAEPTDTIIENEELIGQLEAVRLLNTLGRDNIFNINPNFHTNIMETLMKSMNIEADTSANIGDEIDVYSGVKVGNSYEYINYGKYNVKEIEKDEVEKSYKIKCYDDMMLTMVDYDLQVTYPISVKNLLTAICNHFGFTLDTTTFVNDDNIITTDVFSNIGLTYRDVLSELAIATCSTIEIENGIMYLRYPVNTDLVINEDILNDKNVATGKKYGPVNKLVITKTGDVDPEIEEDTSSITINGLTEIKISDKQIFSTEETRDNLITEMWNYIKDFEYYICDLDTQGLMYVEPLDMFNVSVDNNTYQTIALNDETNISDGLNEEIYNEEIEVTESNYKYTKPEDKKTNNALIDIDKANAQIILKANSQGKIVQVELKADADTGSIFNIDADNININATDILNLLAGNTINLTSNNIVIDSTNFSVDVNGNMTCSNANITDGKLEINSTTQNPKLIINNNNNDHWVRVAGDRISIFADNNYTYLVDIGEAISSQYGSVGNIELTDTNSKVYNSIGADSMALYNSDTGNQTAIDSEHILTPKLIIDDQYGEYGSFTCTKTSGGATIESANYYKFGNVITLYITFTVQTATSAGNNAWVGTVADIPLPWGVVTASAFIGNQPYSLNIDENGDMIIRALTTTLAVNSNNHNISVTYVINS